MNCGDKIPVILVVGNHPDILLSLSMLGICDMICITSPKVVVKLDGYYSWKYTTGACSIWLLTTSKQTVDQLVQTNEKEVKKVREEKEAITCNTDPSSNCTIL